MEAPRVPRPRPRPGRRAALTVVALGLLLASRAALAPASGHRAVAAPAPCAAPPAAPALGVATYNLRSGLGASWRPFAPRASVERRLVAIARTLAEAAPGAAPLDLVGLNEVDFGSRRTGWLDQAAFLAAELERRTGRRYRVVRGETWRRELPGLEVRYGNALLVRHPLRSAGSCRLGGGCTGSLAGVPAPQPRPRGWPERLLGEPRGVVVARIDFHGTALDVLVTHLEAFSAGQRQAEAAELRRRLVRPGVATVLLGDINAVPPRPGDGWRSFFFDRTYAVLTGGRLRDARAELAAGGESSLRRWATYPSGTPRWPLDGVFATSELTPRRAAVIGGSESDHRGLQVGYGWSDPTAACAATVG